MIRNATANDVPQLLYLMQQLAHYENYAEQFLITEQALSETGFNGKRHADFNAIVAEEADQLIGYAAMHVVPFTYDLRPTLVIKELFVTETFRNKGIGYSLFAAILQQARSIDARLLRWQVLPTNTSAMRFYKKFGGISDSAWQHWVLEL